MNHKYNQGDVILVPFPFSDQINSKKRPAVIISGKNTRDLIVAKITSVLSNDENSFLLKDSSLTFKIDNPSEVRTNSLLTIEKKLVIKKIGSIKALEMSLILDKVKANFNQVIV
jgi:mRNA interferase MazF